MTGRFALAAATALGVGEHALEIAPVDASRIPWDSAFLVEELAVDSVALVSALLNRVAEARCGRRTPPVRVDPLRVAASFGSDKLLRIDGAAPPVWAPLSGFWPVPDGWVRTHANYPHHAALLRTLLGVDEDAERERVGDALASWSRFEIEDAAASVGAVVSAVRGAEEWARHPQFAALAASPLLGVSRTGDALARGWRGSGGAPLAGVRVLDLTRVIAGPVATRDLAIAGADVLRVDSPHRPEPAWQHFDTGQQKRSTLLDLDDPGDRATFSELLAAADVLVTGYRPGALDRFGLHPEELARTHPGLVVGTVSAWGEHGPWSERRGFDSIVQATIGVALAERAAHGAERPGALPVQALDHASGHLLAAAVTHALLQQRVDGGSLHVSVALARTGHELMRHRGGPPPAGRVPDELPTAPLSVGPTTVLTAPPPLAFDGAPQAYSAVGRFGRDRPSW